MAEESCRSPKGKMISVDDLIDAYTCYRVVRDDSGQPIDAVMIYANPASEKVLGKSRDQLVGKSITQLLHRERVLHWIEVYKILETDTRKNSYSFYSDFAHRWFDVNIFLDEEDNVNVIYHDVTELQYANMKVSGTEEKYRAIVEGSPDIFIRFDRNLRHIFVSAAVEKLTGIKSKGYIGKTHRELGFDEELCSYWEGRIREVFDKKETLRETYKLGDVYLDWYLIPEFNKSGEVIAVLSISRDITELKKAEEIKKAAKVNEERLNEALELDRIRTEFFANLSHEFKTPLNIIFSSLQLVDKHTLDNEILCPNSTMVRKYVKPALQNCYRLLRLINNLIDVTKIDAGFYEFSPVNCDIVKVVEDITLSTVEYIKSKNIDIVFDTDVEEKIISCDPDKIQRIVLNLLSNAIKFTDEGGSISVNISDGDECITISVEDTGIGIPNDKLEYIFDRFTQIDGSFTRSREGSGIGLSLVKSLVEMHEGAITVNSSIGEGTQFDVMLPVRVLKPERKITLKDCDLMQNNYEEKINIEFSDIYQ